MNQLEFGKFIQIQIQIWIFFEGGGTRCEFMTDIYRGIHNRWDFRDDYTEFLLSVSFIQDSLKL